MQRDQRFKGKSSTGIVDTAAIEPVNELVVENAVESVVEIAVEPVAAAPSGPKASKRSSTRTPLSPLHVNIQSPARVLEQAEKADKPAPGRPEPDAVVKKVITFAPSTDAENAPANPNLNPNPASTSSAPAPLKPRARVVSARNVVSGRLTTQASDVLAAYQAATIENNSNVNPHAGSSISRLRSRVVNG
jgi:hypothetical protein